MDNLDKIKYKYTASPDWVEKIDLVSGAKQSFNIKKRVGLANELQAWKDAGNTIEPQYTTGEQTQKDIDDLESALESQKSRCIQLLGETDNSQLPDYDYPDDVPAITAYRDQIKTIMRSNQIESIPDKLF